MRLAGFLFLLLSLCVFSGYAQSLDAYEQELKSLKAYVDEAPNDSVRLLRNEAFVEKFEEALSQEKSFQHAFESVKPLGNIVSADNKVRMITWNVPFSNGTHAYFGFVQVKTKRKGTKLIALEEDSVKTGVSEMQKVSPSNWYGAIYYDIARVKRRGKTYYTIIGWDGNDLLSTRKVIDALYADRKGNISFGLNKFKMGRRTKRRVMFEYSSEYVMTVKFDKRKKAIVFDHLDVDNNRLKGIPEYYGPDGTYDALLLKRGTWYYEPYYDARNERDKKDREYRNPKKKQRKKPTPPPTHQ